MLENEDLARAVRVSLWQGKIIVGGFHPGDIPVDGSKTVSGHAYTLMHSADKSALFTMRNPWGGNPDVDGSADGVLNIPDDLDVAPTIDLRIVEPGKAAQYGTGVTEAYIPPAFAPGTILSYDASFVTDLLAFPAFFHNLLHIRHEDILWSRVPSSRDNLGGIQTSQPFCRVTPLFGTAGHATDLLKI